MAGRGLQQRLQCYLCGRIRINKEVCSIYLGDIEQTFLGFSINMKLSHFTLGICHTFVIVGMVYLTLYKIIKQHNSAKI